MNRVLAFGVWRLAFRPEGPWDPSPGFSLGNVFCEEPGLKDRQKRKLRDQPRRSQYWGGAEVARFLSVLQTSHAKTYATQAKAWARFSRPFLLRRPGYGGQVGPKRAECQPRNPDPDLQPATRNPQPAATRNP